MSNTFLKAALVGVISAGISMSAMAAGPAAPQPDKEKCYGVAKAGKNDCASATGAHGCAGQAKKDKEAGDWTYETKDACAKLGGSATAPTGATKS